MALITIEERDTAVAVRRACNEVTRHLNEPKEIDWEQRRYEIAKAVCAASFATADDLLLSDIAFDAVRMADELIKQLKEQE